MPRAPRRILIGNDTIFHATWQTINHEMRLTSKTAKQLYYDLLLRYKGRYHMKIFGYCFMDNHIHLCGQAKDQLSFSNFFCVVHTQFSTIYNRRIAHERKSTRDGRRGQVIMDRMKSLRIENEASLFRVLTYIDMNPKRVGKVDHPRENGYSSYRVYAHGEDDPLIDLAPGWEGLGRSDLERQKAYRGMVDHRMKQTDDQQAFKKGTYSVGRPEWVKKDEMIIRQLIHAKVLEWRRRFQELHPKQQE